MSTTSPSVTRTKTLGILGGMGPYASLRFCDSLLRLSIENHGATKNADFPHFLLSSLPVPDLIASRDDEEQTVAMAEREMRHLEAGGVDFIVLACSTMHLFEERLKKAVTVPFLSLVTAVMERVSADGHKRVGLLGSRTTMHSVLYAAPLRRLGIETILPTADEETELVACIQDLVGRGANDMARTLLRSFVDSLHTRGAEAVILGCTELPLVIPQHPSIPVYDSLQILAEAASTEIHESRLFSSAA